ncbi:MAG: Asp-tRNA(Asn)/Glu-tRNA(Gln) amidotransferase subunit GatA [Gammaproteobacteria bacterium]|nr:Asp-tRNA(Asn)/Glu-tRNA(Gln) amidotransferase subunit GatA [Gammaproteobacteria bacterium]
MHTKTITELSKLLHDKKISSVELTTHFLNRIKESNPALNAFITITEENALKQAQNADAKIASGNAEILTGIPIAHKDIFCTAGVKTTCGSKMLDNFISPYDATVVEKCNDAGLVMLGKTNMDEFAMGSSNETSFYGSVKNPWDLTRTPGGSSGGASACVAARIAPIATGTDTGGSVRQPAALTGITGIKPTYGRVSRFGMIAFASSLDQAGILSQSAQDAALLLNIIAGHDKKDSTSINQTVPDYTKNLNDSLKGCVIGLPNEYFTGGLDAGVEAAIQDSIKLYEKLGATFKKISLPHTDLATSAYYVIAPAEASSNLARYDGVRYGYRCENPSNLDDLYKRSRSESFGDEVQRRILIGTYVLSSGFYDAYYIKAQKIRRLISNDFVAAFNDVDFILTPTAPTPAFKLGEKSSDPIAMYLSDIFTIAVNLAGLPGISIPAGFSNNLPVGVQLIGKHFDEAKILNAAHQFQLNTDWHTKMPA